MSPRYGIVLASCLLLLMFSGCVTGKRAVSPYSGTPSPSTDQGRQDQTVFSRNTLMPALTWMEGRITAYEEKTKDWQLLSSRTGLLNLDSAEITQLSTCRMEATDLLAGYNRLHDRLLREQPPESSRRLLETSLSNLKNMDIHYLESNCSQLLADTALSSSGRMAEGMEEIESRMKTALAEGNYAEVITTFQTLPLPSGAQPAYGISFTYGQALLKSGREQDARMVFSDLLSRARNQGALQEEISLLNLLGDLDYGLSDYRAARSHYEDLERLLNQQGQDASTVRRKLAMLESADMHSLQVRSYGALLLSSLTYNAGRDGFTFVQQILTFQQQYPLSMVAMDVDEMRTQATAEAEKWFGDLLGRVDTLIMEQKDQEALQLLQGVPLDILPLDKQAILKLKVDSLAATGPVVAGQPGIVEEEILQTSGFDTPTTNPETTGQDPASVSGESHVAVSELEKTFEQGMADMQAKEYDKAIAVFTGLLNTSMGAKAAVQIEEAARLAAQEERKKAAELFVRASHSTSTEARREMLLSSRALLEEILRKYPQSGLDEKVKRNLHRINQELAALERNESPAIPPTDTIH